MSEDEGARDRGQARKAKYWDRLIELWDADPEADVPGDEIWALIESFRAGVSEPPRRSAGHIRPPGGREQRTQTLIQVKRMSDDKKAESASITDSQVCSFVTGAVVSMLVLRGGRPIETVQEAGWLIDTIRATFRRTFGRDPVWAAHPEDVIKYVVPEITRGIADGLAEIAKRCQEP